MLILYFLNEFATLLTNLLVLPHYLLSQEDNHS